MPCRDDGQAEYEDRQARQALHDRNDIMARIICFISEKLETEYPILADELLQANKEYANWLFAHKKADAKRKLEEKIAAENHKKAVLANAKKVLDELTPEQRKALGLA